MANLKTKIFDGIVLQLSSELVDGVNIYTVTVENSGNVYIYIYMPKLIRQTTSLLKATCIFNNWQAGLQNTCGGFV